MRAAPFVDHPGPAVKPTGLRYIQPCPHLCQSARPQPVIRVEPGQNPAPGQGHATVDGIGLPLVRLEMEHQPLAAFLLQLEEQLPGAIRGAGVHDQQLDLNPLLVQHRTYRLLQKDRLLEAGHDDGDERRRSHGKIMHQSRFPPRGLLLMISVG